MLIRCEAVKNVGGWLRVERRKGDVAVRTDVVGLRTAQLSSADGGPHF